MEFLGHPRGASAAGTIRLCSDFELAGFESNGFQVDFKLLRPTAQVPRHGFIGGDDGMQEVTFHEEIQMQFAALSLVERQV